MASSRWRSFNMRPTPLIAILRQDAHHVTVQIRCASRLETGYRQQKSDHSRAVERAEHLPAHFRRNNEEPYRQEFDLRQIPRSLSVDVQLPPDQHGGQRADLDHSERFASCHNASISSMSDSGRAFASRLQTRLDVCESAAEFCVAFSQRLLWIHLHEPCQIDQNEEQVPDLTLDLFVRCLLPASANSCNSSSSFARTCSAFSQSNPDARRARADLRCFDQSGQRSGMLVEQ